MRPKRWWSVILTMGLFMALIPMSAQAGPNRSFARQPHRPAFTPPQPRAHVNRMPSQPHRWQQPRGQANGWHGQNRQWQQPRGRAFGWNGHQRQGHQPQGNHYGWNGHQRQWQQPRGYANGWNNQHRQWQQPRGNAHGWNGQHPGQQQRNAYGRNNPQHQWQRPPNGGQPNHPVPYNRADYPARTHSPNIAPRSSGYSPHTAPAGHTGARPEYRQHDPSGNATVQGRSPEGVIKAAEYREPQVGREN